MTELRLTAKHPSEYLREDIQEFADKINIEISAHFNTETGFEQLVFTPRSWAKNQPELPFDE